MEINLYNFLSSTILISITQVVEAANRLVVGPQTDFLFLDLNGSLTVVGETLFVYLNEGKQHKKIHKIRKFSTEIVSLHQVIGE